MKVSQIGEFGLITRLAAQSGTNIDTDSPASRQLVTGIGDDAAVWRPAVPCQLVTVDSLVENVHFTRRTTTWEKLGEKALAVNLSDIAAMGGVPLYALISLGLPPDTRVENVTRLYAGMNSIARKYGVRLVGGDTVSSPALFISVTVLGSAVNKEGNVLSRAAAKPGDKVAVTGTLGDSAGGLKILLEKLSFPRRAAAKLKAAHLTPAPRVAEGQLLVKNGVKCGMDISDGLAGDLAHICEMSGVGASINVDAVPLSPELRQCFADCALPLALNGGEDYELLFTAPPARIRAAQRALKCPVTVVGEITAANPGKVRLFNRRGQRVEIEKSGWDHFQK